MTTAVCISGALRSFLSPTVQNNLFLNFHRIGYHYFLSSDRAISVADERLKILLDNQSVTNTKHGCTLRSCSQSCKKYLKNETLQHFTSRHMQRLDMAIKLSKCFDMIMQRSLRFSFEYIIRIRPDHIFISAYDYLLHRSTSILLSDDNIAISRFTNLKTVFLTPFHVYSTCIPNNQWSLICNRVFTYAEIKSLSRCPPCFPCEPMRLIGVIDNVSLNEIKIDFCSVSFNRENVKGISSSTLTIQKKMQAKCGES